MLSRIQYPKFPLLSFKVSKRNNYRLIGIIFFVVCFIIAGLIGYPYRILALFISYYILSGLFMHIVNLGKIETNNQGT